MKQISKDGSVQFMRKPQPFLNAPESTSFVLNDLIRTGTNTTASVWMTKSETTVRMRPLSTLEIQQPENHSSTLLDLWNGALYFLSRGAQRDVIIKSRHGTAAHVGTEFVISVDDEKTVIDVLDGTATLTNDLGGVTLAKGDRGEARSGRMPTKTHIAATNLVQWWLYYPAVIDANDLAFTASEYNSLSNSIAWYKLGDLSSAKMNYPGYPNPEQPGSDAGKIYLASLYLSGGDVDKAQALFTNQSSSVAEALRWMVDAVQNNTNRAPEVHTSASEWLGLSYYYQARHDLNNALKAAQRSVALSTNFAFGWERVAELQFSFGATKAATDAVDRSLKLAPKNAQAHALKGFLLSADNRLTEARSEFENAITLDSNLANGWLGRGLIRIRTGDRAGGRQDLKTAAILEPERSLLRSYLGKVYASTGDSTRANEEFTRAQKLDASDPVPWLYSALEKSEENRINEAVDDLEKSIELNGNRSVYRSQLLLDEDLAVRSANLAAIYRDAGLTDVSVSEASKAITSDYANYTAHLFLANSYNDLRDPNMINLRYETATFSEYLIANLLSPVGGSKLSPYVSQQEYSRLFTTEGVGFDSDTTYLSRGDWSQSASFYGWQKNTGYAVDVSYASQNGERPNDNLEQRAVSVQLKQQLTPRDSAYVQTTFTDTEAGDVEQVYDPSFADPNLHTKDNQTPNLFLGYHHDWSPGVHTLLLAGRLEDNFSFATRNARIPGVIVEDSGTVDGNVGSYTHGASIPDDTFKAYHLRSSFETYSIELQQIAQISDHTLIGGIRFQDGQVKTHAEQIHDDTSGIPYGPSNIFVAQQSSLTDLTRLGIYAYDQWRVADPLWLTAGLSYDELSYPANVNLAPISNTSRDSSQVSPKAGIVWTPLAGTTVRGAFTRSLGGLSYDSSVRLEPVQVAGFDQAYRSLIPESVVGAIPGSKFQTFDLSLEQKFKTRTYAILRLELLQSDVAQDVGVFDLFLDHTVAAQQRQSLKYEEKSLSFSLNQLLGNNWSLGADYKVSHADLRRHYADLPPGFFPPMHEAALLHTLDFHVIFNHACGFFAEGQALWRGQSNFHDDSILAGDHFWQANLYAGYRFYRRRAQITLGLLNVTGQDYHLNPLNLYDELPHERTLSASLSLNF